MLKYKRIMRANKFLNSIDFTSIMSLANAANYEPAGFWKRALAFVYDLIIINLIIFWPFERLFSKYISNMNIFSNASITYSFPPKIYYAIFFISILALLYFTFMEYYLSQTLGMMLLNIKAIGPAEDIGFWKSMARNCFILPFFPFYILWFVEPLHLAFYKDRLLERLTHTRTILLNAKKPIENYDLKKV
jgi:uncharacterized RDD family membrane protein YckC